MCVHSCINCVSYAETVQCNTVLSNTELRHAKINVQAEAKL